MLHFIIGFILGSFASVCIYALLLATKYNEKEVNKNDKGN